MKRVRFRTGSIGLTILPTIEGTHNQSTSGLRISQMRKEIWRQRDLRERSPKRKFARVRFRYGAGSPRTAIPPNQYQRHAASKSQSIAGASMGGDFLETYG